MNETYSHYAAELKPKSSLNRKKGMTLLLDIFFLKKRADRHKETRIQFNGEIHKIKF